jgi:hypothetical protein
VRASLALPASIVPSLVAILRDHSPSLRLPWNRGAS